MNIVSCQDIYQTPSVFVYIRVCGKTYKVKRFQLVSKSAYFRELLQLRPSACVISLDNVNLEIFDVILLWLQTDIFQPNLLPLKSTIELFNLALQLKMPELLGRCKEFVTKSFLDTNVTDIYQLVEQYGSSDLYHTIHDVLTSSFEHIVKNPNFLHFNVDFVCMLLSDSDIITSSERVVFDAAVEWLNFEWTCRSRYAVDVMATVRMGLMSKHDLFLASLKASTHPVLELPRVQKMLLDAFMYHAAVKTNRISCFQDLVPTARAQLAVEDFKQMPPVDIPQAFIVPSSSTEKNNAVMKTVPMFTSMTLEKLTPDMTPNLPGTSNAWPVTYPEMPLCSFTGRAGEDKVKLSSSEKSKCTSKSSSPMCTSRRQPPSKKLSKSVSGKSQIESAVTTIQAYVRGFLTRKNLKQEQTAANKIQRTFRKWKKTKSKRDTSKDSSPSASESSITNESEDTSLALTDVPSILIIGGLDPNQQPVKTATTLLRYDPLLNVWSAISTSPVPFVQSACAKLHNNIYISGGIYVTYKAKSKTTRSTWCLNYENGEWKKCRDMIHPRAYHCLVGYCGKIFAIGGKSTDDDILNSAEYYEPGLDRWFQITPMHCARMAMAAIEFHELIWVCGGASKDSDNATLTIIGSVECYSYFTNTWCVQVPLCVPRMSAMLVQASGTMALLGGATLKPGTVEAEMYVLERESWSVSRPLHRNRESSACVTLLDLTFLIGGYSSEEEVVLKSVECFLPGLSGRVDYVPDLPYPLNGHCAVVVSPILKAMT